MTKKKKKMQACGKMRMVGLYRTQPRGSGGVCACVPQTHNGRNGFSGNSPGTSSRSRCPADGLPGPPLQRASASAQPVSLAQPCWARAERCLSPGREGVALSSPEKILHRINSAQASISKYRYNYLLKLFQYVVIHMFCGFDIFSSNH